MEKYRGFSLVVLMGTPSPSGSSMKAVKSDKSKIWVKIFVSMGVDKVMKENVILVNEQDQEIGVAGKLEVHQEGKLHRAFSIFIFNNKGETLLQQRAPDKYHSGGLWSNACCSHPAPGESLESASERRLFEEMGIRCKLRKAFHFVYKAKLNNKLIEHEFDHVFIGTYSGGSVNPNPHEVMSHRWVSFEALQEEMHRFPKKFTIWFKIAVAPVFRVRKSWE